DVAEEGGLEVAGESAGFANEGDAEGEGGGGNDADGGIAADVAAFGGGVDQERREETPKTGAEVEVPAHEVADDRSPEHGVGEPVPDVTHPPQDDRDADHAAKGADEGSDDETVAEELVLEGFGEVGHDEASGVRRQAIGVGGVIAHGNGLLLGGRRVGGL